MGRQTDGTGRKLSVWWVTLGRDVLASVLATGLATFAFTVPGHRDPPVPETAFGPTGKLVGRLGDDGTEGLHRALRVYETIALLRQPPTPEPAAVTIAAADAPARPVAHARTEEPAMKMVSVLPPERPRTLPVTTVVAAADASGPRPQPIRLLGWAVPMSEALPSREETIGRLASIGDTVGQLGAGLVEGVRLP